MTASISDASLADLLAGFGETAEPVPTPNPVPLPTTTVDGIIAAAAAIRAPHPCDDPFCGDGGCGWPPADHIKTADRRRLEGGAAGPAPVPGHDDGIRHVPATPEWDDEPRQVPAGPPPSTVAEMREVLSALDADRPRSRQTALGPSELGTPCQRQIAMKLAGVPRQPEDKRPPWAPMQGTAMHTLMEEALRFHNAQLGRERWIVEEQLTVHPGLGGGVHAIRGHGDAFDQDAGMVVDWKYVGVTTLRDVKRKTIPNEQLVKPDYRVQAHLYGYGHAAAGRDVRWVRLVFLARSHDYADSTEWTERYQPEIALEAIYRYFGTLDLLDSLKPDVTPALWGVVPATPGKACSWCPFRRVGGPADSTGCPGDTETKIDKQVQGLVA